MSIRKGYLLTGIATGLILLFSFLGSLPDGKLHLVFCDVGQGDAAYIRFADGRDMLVDGGPNNKVLQCLGRSMPFWDRHINIVAMTHPQKDHMEGLIAVLDRYDVDYFVRSDVDNVSDGYQKLSELVKTKNIPVRFVARGEQIFVGSTTLSVVWPTSAVLGATSEGEINDASIVFLLSYGSFDALFTGDADTRVENGWSTLALDGLEVLKVPHHGSRTGMSEDFIKKLTPQLAVISVGKNSYSHPNADIISKLALTGSRVLRTDQEGNIEVTSNGKGWEVKN